MEPLLFTLYATGYTFAMTALGSAAVFISKHKPSPLFTKLSLGFAAGIMTAAAVWSLLTPAIEQAESYGYHPAISVGGGFVLGAAFLILLDKIMPHLHLNSKEPEGPKSHLSRHSLLFLAVTIHNIPEGMAVGLTMAAAISTGSPEAFSAAVALAIGMGIQNIPEGTAVALPMHSAGTSRLKAFALGAFSGIVEPIAAVIVVYLASFFIPLMPWMLAFAAGAMIYVVVEELIPEASLGEHSDVGTISVLCGFVMMMILDTSLG